MGDAMVLGSRRRLALTAVAALILVGGATEGVVRGLHGGDTVAVVEHATPPPSPSPGATPAGTPTPTPGWVSGATLPRSLQASLDLHAAAAAVPLRFQAPSIGVDVPVLGVGLTPRNAVDAPEGPAGSSLWDDGFWYRGGAEPGQPGVFAMAGHVDRVGGAPAAFWNLHRIAAGAMVGIVDQRTRTVWHYRITETDEFDDRTANGMAVLSRIYGPDVATGRPATVPADKLARISIITCAGTWNGTQYDHRFVAFGDLVGETASPPPA